MCACLCACVCVPRQNLALANGSVVRMGSGDGITPWLASQAGPILQASVYGGQTTDLTRTVPGPTPARRVFGAEWEWAPAVWSPPLGLPNVTAPPCATFGCTNLKAQMGDAVLKGL